MKKPLSLVALALVAALTVAGCGNGSSSSSTTTSTSASSSASSASSADFNAADVTFAQSMIPHHKQAVEMAKMAQMHASTSEVKQLADKIKAAQGPDIETMSGWLKDWGKKVPSDSMSGMDHSSGDMTGMMSDADMKKLDAATGPAFDRMFLTMMVSHHSSAIEMAKTEQKDGKNGDAVAIAKKIEVDQTSEIAVMNKLKS